MNIKQLSKFVKNMPKHHTLMLAANHGMGKSQVVSTVLRDVIAKREGVKPEEVAVLDRRASQLDPGDLTGGIFLVGGQTFNAPPYWLPIHPTDGQWLEERLKAAGREWVPFQTAKVGIMFLDEVNRARPETLQCIFELILDRRLHGIRIPENWYIIAAVNADRDTYDVQEQDPAFTDRVILMNFEPSFEELFAHLDEATSAGKIHEVIAMYLRQRNDKIDPSPDLIKNARDKGEKIFSRRSWYRLGECLQDYANDGEDIVASVAAGNSTKELIEVCTGYIGSADAVAFSTYCKDEFSVLTPKDILDKYDDKISARIKKMGQTNAVGLAGLARALNAELTKRPDKLSTKIHQSILRFMEDIPREVCSGFWKEWHEAKASQADAWYVTPRRRKVVVFAIMGPNGYPKWEESQKKKGIDLDSDVPDGL